MTWCKIGENLHLPSEEYFTSPLPVCPVWCMSPICQNQFQTERERKHVSIFVKDEYHSLMSFSARWWHQICSEETHLIFYHSQKNNIILFLYSRTHQNSRARLGEVFDSEVCQMEDCLWQTSSGNLQVNGYLLVMTGVYWCPNRERKEWHSDMIIRRVTYVSK